MSEPLVLLGIGIAAASGVPGLFVCRSSNAGQWVSVLLAVIGSVCGLSGVGVFWATGDAQPIVRPWSIPGAEFHVAMDGLSAIFLVPIFLVSMLGSVYGLGYWKQAEHPTNGRKLRLFYGLLPAGMALLVIARNSILFMLGWEVMAISAFFLVTTEDHKPEIRAAGWVYLVATKLATVSLFALFALLRAASGSFTLAPLHDGALTSSMATSIFAFTVVGFGLKAGLMPFHVWLPSAHANAPSHVSAIMSGVILKMGIYGILRITSLIPHPPVEWGATLLGLGAFSGVLGIAFAIGQRDLKRLLAYSSIENIGIILIGIGLALVGKSLGRGEWIVLGLSGALLHVWNHALFKGLLFLSAGSIIHAVETREIDQLGGLAKRMPRTALCFVIGTLGACGLPALNGFVSEFLIYLSLFDSLGINGGPAFEEAAFAAPALALIGALAVACFVKVFGAVFLGTARSEHASHAHESGLTMLGPMSVLAACCFFIGLAPTKVAPLLAQGVLAWAPELGDAGPGLLELAPLDWISIMAVALVAALALTSVLLRLRLQKSLVETGATWGCGYVAPTPKIQYTSSSFAEMLVGLFSWVLRPRTHRPTSLPLFPQRTDFHTHVPDIVLDEAVLPAFQYGADKFSWFRRFQQGKLHFYLLYIFVALVALLLWR
jgi:hydrogenase-4 component B